MTTTMLETDPQSVGLDRTELAAVVDAPHVRGEACAACADACLSDSMG